MPALPPITNPLQPRVSRSWITPIRFRTKPYRELSQSLSEALEELESRYPSHRKLLIAERRAKQQKRKKD